MARSNCTRQDVQALKDRLIAESVCEVAVIGAPLEAIQIKFGGPLAELPSANRHEIAAKKVRNAKTGKVSVIRFSKKTNAQLAKLQVMSTLYALATARAGIYPPPTFGAEKVHILVLASNGARGRRKWDVENVLKYTSDWLEDVGVIDDDSQAEPHPFKAQDYGREQGETTIFIIRRDLGREFAERWIVFAEELVRQGGVRRGVQS